MSQWVCTQLLFLAQLRLQAFIHYAVTVQRMGLESGNLGFVLGSPNCVILGRSSNFSESQFPHL